MKEVKAEDPYLLSPMELYQLLDRFGIPQPRQAQVGSPAEAAIFAGQIGFPVVLKVVAEGVTHKSDVGGVRVGLTDAIAVAQAAEEMAERLAHSAPEARLEGYLVQSMATSGVEMIVGVKRDPIFGPMVMVGLGGIWVELVRDHSLRPAPISRQTAREMIAELRGSALLYGYRGNPPADVESFLDVVVAVGNLAVQVPEIQELDLNPVLVGSVGAGSTAVDARALTGVSSDVSGPDTQGHETRQAAIHQMLNPRHIAVVGASADLTKFGSRLIRYLKKHNYSGQVYPVNPRETEVQGYPCFPSVSEIPGDVDMAAIMLPDTLVAEAIAECGKKGIKSAIIYGSGFAESGAEGLQRQTAVVETARRYGVHLCGPNTVGVYSSVGSTCAAFGMAFEADDPPIGNVGMISQSGALGGSLLSRGWAQGLGFSRWVTTGNEVDLGLSDFMLYLADDPHTRVIALFLESIRDPLTFHLACQRAAANGKPIFVYKTGRSVVGQRAVQSHTGSLAGDDAVYDAIFQAWGVVRVPDLQSLADAALAASWQPLPEGRRIAVISTSGGACSVVADECERLGLEIPLLSPARIEQVASLLPAFASAQNPVDVTMEATRRPELMAQVLDVLLQDSTVDAALMMLTTNADPPAYQAAKAIVEVAARYNKPVIVARTGAEFLAPKALQWYQHNQLPVFPMPDRAVRTLQLLASARNQQMNHQKSGGD